MGSKEERKAVRVSEVFTLELDWIEAKKKPSNMVSYVKKFLKTWHFFAFCSLFTELWEGGAHNLLKLECCGK